MSAFRILAQIAEGKHDDATISAALDATREDDSADLAEAVRRVGRALLTHRYNTDMAAVTSASSRSERFRLAVRAHIVAVVRELEDRSYTLYYLANGDPPSYRVVGPLSLVTDATTVSVHVGATWIVNRMKGESGPGGMNAVWFPDPPDAGRVTRAGQLSDVLRELLG